MLYTSNNKIIWCMTKYKKIRSIGEVSNEKVLERDRVKRNIFGTARNRK